MQNGHFLHNTYQHNIMLPTRTTRSALQIKAYQHNSQHGCNKCPDCVASKSRRQPAAGCERVFITAK